MALTAIELDLMRHALGLNRGKVSTRNSFAAEPNSDDDKTWRGLAAVGLARSRGTINSAPNVLNIWVVTEAGKAAVMEERIDG